MTTREEPCLCGGTIVADPADPSLAVLRHSRTAEHAAWRRRTLFVACRGVGSPCAVRIPWWRDRCSFCRRSAELVARVTGAAA